MFVMLYDGKQLYQICTFQNFKQKKNDWCLDLRRLQWKHIYQIVRKKIKVDFMKESLHLNNIRNLAGEASQFYYLPLPASKMS